MFGLCRCVGWWNMNLPYPRYHCTNPMFLLVDNSDSPSIVEQSQQGCDSSCYTLLAVIPSSVNYTLCLSASLLQHGYILLHFPVSCFSVSLHSLCSSLLQLLQLGLCSPLYSGCFLIEPWDRLSDNVHPGIACLACWVSNWAGAFWVSLSGLWLATFC